MKIQTGMRGYDLFQRAMEKQIGMDRLYVPKKLPRIINKNIRTDVFGKPYKMIKLNG